MITSEIISDERRSDHADEIFGVHFPLAIEPAIFSFADRLSPDYQGGYWQFYALSNGGFYMAPDGSTYTVTSDNGFKGVMEAEAFGITACLYAYSHLSFTDKEDLADECITHYHLLREYMMDHPEVRAILAATD